MFRRKIVLTLIILNSAYHVAFSQTGVWTWIKGDSTLNSLGSEGTKQVSSPSNEPSARYAPAFWTDTAGNFWMFGGVNGYSDMWMFNPLTNEWTWMNGKVGYPLAPRTIGAAKGVYSDLNVLGNIGYGMFTWTTPNNHLWLYGGQNSKSKADLWQYSPLLNQWAWMGDFSSTNYGVKGVPSALNMPGPRHESTSAWVDSTGNLWMFGGFSTVGQGRELNDLWKYDVATGLWTWMSGSDSSWNSGIWGVKGMPDVRNCPPSRSTNLHWKDKHNNFWVSGGMGWFDFYTPSLNTVNYQDIWKFNPSDLTWTWVAGKQGVDNSEPIGSSCENNINNKEGARYENRAIWNFCNKMINYGGLITYGNWMEEDSFKMRNDLWSLDLASHVWTKVSEGPNEGRYGIKQTPDAANYPQVRVGAISFKDRNNNLWMFGGTRVDSMDGYLTGYYNDLWKYVVDSACIGCISCEATVAGVISALNDTVCNDQPPVLHFSGIISNIQWQYSLDGVNFVDLAGITGEDCLDIPSQTSFYRIRLTEGNCEYLVDPIKIVVEDCSSAGISFLVDASISIYPNPSSTNNVQLSMSNSLTGSNLDIYDANGRIVFHSALSTPNSALTLPLSSGVYFLKIHSEKVSVTKKWVRL